MKRWPLMSCNDKDGGTHHYACDCREAYVRRLEAVVKEAQELIRRRKEGRERGEDFIFLDKVLSALRQI